VRQKHLKSKHPKKRARTRVSGQRLNLVGEQVRKIRLALVPFVTQEDLAGRLANEGFENLTRVIINRIEAGKRTVLDIELVALAKALRVSVQRLFTNRS